MPPAKKKTIWITGCTGGLGRALLPRLAEGGHVLAGCGRREEAVAALREEFPAPHFFAPCDVSGDAAVERFCREALAATGPPDLLVNNAAVINDPAPLWEVPAEDFERLTAVNVNGTFHVIRHALPAMLEKGEGVVVNLSSGWGRSTSPEVAPYCASKWAVEGLTQALSQELPPGLAAVSLNPGIIDTPMLRSAFGEGAAEHPSAEQWARTAAPFLLALAPADNGAQLTAP